MKHLPLCIIITISLLACNNKKKAVVPESATPAEIAEAKSDLDRKMEELQQLTPYTEVQMRTLIPRVLDGDSASMMSAIENMGTGFIMAIYPLSDTSSIEMSAFDCGGIAGAGIYNNQFVNEIGEQWEGVNGYKKLVDFKGGKAIEQVNISRKTCSLTYMDLDRFLVTVVGKNIDISELKDKADEVKL